MFGNYKDKLRQEREQARIARDLKIKSSMHEKISESSDTNNVYIKNIIGNNKSVSKLLVAGLLFLGAIIAFVFLMTRFFWANDLGNVANRTPILITFIIIITFISVLYKLIDPLS